MTAFPVLETTALVTVYFRPTTTQEQINKAVNQALSSSLARVINGGHHDSAAYCGIMIRLEGTFTMVTSATNTLFQELAQRPDFRGYRVHIPEIAWDKPTGNTH